MFMMMAEVASSRSTCDRGPEQKFRKHKGTGAVIVTKDNRRLSIGYAGSPPGAPHCDTAGHEIKNSHCVRTIHAEENAILNAHFDLKGSKIYITTVPCYDCCKRIASVGISEVRYQHVYTSRHFDYKYGLKFLNDCGINTIRYIMNKEVFDGVSS
jgi:dCMP deaminase